MITDNFVNRHNGPRESELSEMFQMIGVENLETLINQTVPDSIRLKSPLNLPKGMNEYEYLSHLKSLASKNKIFKSYIGLGYYNCIVPGVIQRNVLENPGWYTSYTPYQAEISQGRLEALLNFQTMVSDLTALPIANCSLLDEATAAAEAMIMLYNARPRSMAKSGANIFLVSKDVFPQTIEVLKTRAKHLGISLQFCDNNAELSEKVYGILIQYPDQNGQINNFGALAIAAHEKGIGVVAAADLLSLSLLKAPGEWGADVAVGSTQRLGVPMGFGGPHAGYFATTEKHKRNIPGRIIGISKDAQGNQAYRMALQTREQHIKRDRATSNICTAQALLASMAGFYAAYHGPDGLKMIASDIFNLTSILSAELKKLGYTINNSTLFDTLSIDLPSKVKPEDVKEKMLAQNINLRYRNKTSIGVSIDETTSQTDIEQLLKIFAELNSQEYDAHIEWKNEFKLPKEFARTSTFMTHPAFNTHHSETEMMRYLKYLENKDLALNRTMIPLGSCTMKLNAASELFALSWPEFGEIHPFAPKNQVEGYLELIRNLESDLCEITGFKALSFQPNSGASGEYTGLLVIREYLESIGQQHRNICLIPSSAHGTNPASSVMAGLKVVVVDCDEKGNIDLQDLKQKAEANSDHLAALMVTYPSTHGVFEESILELVEIIHNNGGQVYMDGANMNAQVGLTSPGAIGADVCHLNLHKTFAIPHGGGGPGVGPIGVAEHLVPFLPKHPLVETGGKTGITAVSAAPYGSASLLTISYGYIKLLGGEGLTKATEYAILNANYLKSALEAYYPILYTGTANRVAHEMILDCNHFSKTANVKVIDIAKRLMDYGFHAPTVAFPVHGTLMVEPTESEPLSELNRFVDAMIKIREEIKEIEDGGAEQENNLIANAPHTLEMVMDEDWEFPYSKKRAAFPVAFIMPEKYWPPITKIDDAFGDRNLICTCAPIEDYQG